MYYFTLKVGAGADTHASSAPKGRGAPGVWCEGWRQAACYLPEPRRVRRGERVSLLLVVSELGIRFDLLPDDGAARAALAPAGLAPAGRRQRGPTSCRG